MLTEHSVDRPAEPFVAAAQSRLSQVREMLQAWQQNAPVHLGPAERTLRHQAAESEAWGFPGIARLCEDLADCVAASRKLGERSRLTPAALLNACKNLELYLEVVAGGLTPKRS